jgi:hypothetical protein
MTAVEKRVPQLRWQNWALVVVGCLVAGAAAFGYIRHPNRTAETTLDAGIVAAVPSAAELAIDAAAQSDEATVELRVLVTPTDAKLFLDDKELGVSPFQGTMRRDNAKHLLRVEASGHLSKTVDVSLDRASTVEVVLVKAAEHEPGPHRTTVPGPRPKPPPTTGAVRPGNCGQPFFLDDQGIKHMRPECL